MWYFLCTWSVYSSFYWKSSYLVLPLYWTNILTSHYAGSPHIWSFLWTGSTVSVFSSLYWKSSYLVLHLYWKNILTSRYAGSPHIWSFLWSGSICLLLALLKVLLYSSPSVLEKYMEGLKSGSSSVLELAVSGRSFKCPFITFLSLNF